ncbi:hypothetical protein SH528x_001603 [Novipirellula sp. SH528]|uniref:hypothetical protein n=1 Tax=Novipirellula sp. SH528 TaxID=3454466 RepID=UPI003FA1486F
MFYGSLQKFFGDFGGDRDCDCRGDREIVGVNRGLIARRGRLISDILRHRCQHHHRRILDHRVVDGLYRRPDVGDGYDSWQHEPIARHQSGDTDKQDIGNRRDVHSNRNPVGPFSPIRWITQARPFGYR